MRSLRDDISDLRDFLKPKKGPDSRLSWKDDARRRRLNKFWFKWTPTGNAWPGRGLG